MKHLNSLYPIYGGAFQIQQTVIVQRAWTLSSAGNPCARGVIPSPYIYPSPEVVHYLGMCKISVPLSYNPHAVFTRKGLPLLD